MNRHRWRFANWHQWFCDDCGTPRRWWKSLLPCRPDNVMPQRTGRSELASPDAPVPRTDRS